MDFYDFIQGLNLGKIAPEVGRSGRNLEEAGRSIAELEDSVRRLSLLCSAMWSLLKEATGLTDEKLAARIRELEGESKGPAAIRPSTRRCPNCGKVNEDRRKRCLYCGHALRSPGKA